MEPHEKELENDLNELLFEWYIDVKAESSLVAKKHVHIADINEAIVESWKTTDYRKNIQIDNISVDSKVSTQSAWDPERSSVLK